MVEISKLSSYAQKPLRKPSIDNLIKVEDVLETIEKRSLEAAGLDCE
jgi:hypothetical protein